MSSGITFGLLGFTLAVMPIEKMCIADGKTTHVTNFSIICSGLYIMYMGYNIRKYQRLDF